jgi:phage recombination protein Bet
MELARNSQPKPTVLAAIGRFTQEQVDLIARTICSGATNDELALFIAICDRTGLDPFARQIYSVARWDKRAGKNVRQTQVSIDGARLIAQRSGEYAGQEGPYWCGEDGVWRDCWLSKDPPMAAKVGVMRKGFAQPLYAVALFDEYAQRSKDGHLIGQWVGMPVLMIAKCAEALALRKAFPAELSGVYTGEEMGQADNPAKDNYLTPVIPEPVKHAPPALAAPTIDAEASVVADDPKPAPSPVKPAEAKPSLLGWPKQGTAILTALKLVNRDQNRTAVLFVNDDGVKQWVSVDNVLLGQVKLNKYSEVKFEWDKGGYFVALDLRLLTPDEAVAHEPLDF